MPLAPWIACINQSAVAARPIERSVSAKRGAGNTDARRMPKNRLTNVPPKIYYGPWLAHRGVARSVTIAAIMFQND